MAVVYESFVDLKTVPELESAILTEVRAAYPSRKISWDGLLGQTSILQVGETSLWVSIQDVLVRRQLTGRTEPTGRHRLCIGHPNLPRQTFYEDKKGRFALSLVSRAVVTALANAQETVARIRKATQAKHFLDAECSRLQTSYLKDIPPEAPLHAFVAVVDAEQQALLLQFEGLSLQQAEKLLAVAKEAGVLEEVARPQRLPRTIWDELREGSSLEI